MLATAPTSTGFQAGAAQQPPEATYVKKPALPALTGLRTLLALFIVLFHFTPGGLERYFHVGGHTLHLTLYPVIDTGYVFVSFFFLISGYILAYNYLDRLDRISLADFWVARLSRLYPVYLFALLLFSEMLAVEWHSRPHGDFWLGTAASLVLMQGWFPTLATFWNTVAWTLSCEITLYAIFPWLLRRRWPERTGTLIALGLGLWALGLVPHIIYIALNPDHLPTIATHVDGSRVAHSFGLDDMHLHLADATRYSGGFWVDWLKYTPLPYLCTFLAGMALGKLQSVAAPSARQRGWIAVAGFVLAFLAFYEVVPRVPYILVHGGLLSPVFAVIIFGLSGANAVSRVFAWKPLVAVGSASYCLYLLHFNTFVLIHDHHLPELLHVTRFDPWISYVAVVLFAVAVQRLLEKPAQRSLLGAWKRHRTRAAGHTRG